MNRNHPNGLLMSGEIEFRINPLAWFSCHLYGLETCEGPWNLVSRVSPAKLGEDIAFLHHDVMVFARKTDGVLFYLSADPEWIISKWD